MGILQEEYWGGLPCSSPGDLPDPEIEPQSAALQADSLPSEPRESPRILGWVVYPLSSWSSPLRNWTGVSCIPGGFFTSRATREAWEECSALILSEQKHCPFPGAHLPPAHCPLNCTRLLSAPFWLFGPFLDILLLHSSLALILWQRRCGMGSLQCGSVLNEVLFSGFLCTTHVHSWWRDPGHARSSDRPLWHQSVLPQNLCLSFQNLSVILCCVSQTQVCWAQEGPCPPSPAPCTLLSSLCYLRLSRFPWGARSDRWCPPCRPCPQVGVHCDPQELCGRFGGAVEWGCTVSLRSCAGRSGGPWSGGALWPSGAVLGGRGPQSSGVGGRGFCHLSQPVAQNLVHTEFMISSLWVVYHVPL